MCSGCGGAKETRTSREQIENQEQKNQQDGENTDQFQSILKTEEEEVISKSFDQEASINLEGKVNNSDSATIVVQVCGEVVSPGVYRIEEGSRIEAAIKLAGGLTDDAAYASINQAAYAKDGQMIYVCSKEQYTYAPTEDNGGVNQGNNQSAKVNINRANKEELMTIPGIGEAKAQLIISYREEHGCFDSINEIMEIDGIKEGLFNQMKNMIIVE